MRSPLERILLMYGGLPYKLKIDRLFKIYKINMAVVPSSKTSARLEARIPVETKELLQRAADLEGRSLTDFVIGTVQMEAYRVIERHKTLKLSLEDSKVFVDALLDSPEPNDALKKAKLRCEQVMPV